MNASRYGVRVCRLTAQLSVRPICLSGQAPEGTKLKVNVPQQPTGFMREHTRESPECSLAASRIQTITTGSHRVHSPAAFASFKFVSLLLSFSPLPPSRLDAGTHGEAEMRHGVRTRSDWRCCTWRRGFS